MIRRNYAFYRGVATKYLNRYMALFLFMRRLKDMDSSKKTETLIGTIKWFHCHITRESLKEQHLFSVMETAVLGTHVVGDFDTGTSADTSVRPKLYKHMY